MYVRGANKEDVNAMYGPKDKIKAKNKKVITNNSESILLIADFFTCPNIKRKSEKMNVILIHNPNVSLKTICVYFFKFGIIAEKDIAVSKYSAPKYEAFGST